WVFLQSKVNNGYYDGNELPSYYWKWPEGTWFQTRLEYLRDHEPCGLTYNTIRYQRDADEMRALHIR
ncbi:MAG TPA: hypothetical protein VFM35_04090, partial [Candidatus Binatia bacterium]|nr:hypothetical protein [Candidatus Binatia bacterium]